MNMLASKSSSIKSSSTLSYKLQPKLSSISSSKSSYSNFFNNKKYSYTNGDSYTGTWKDRKKDGKGVYCYFRSGAKYDGMWKDDKKDGKGVYYYKNGNKWIGTWKDGKMDGEMSFVRKDGRETKLVYQNGQIIQAWGDLTDFITEQKSKKPEKGSRYFVSLCNEILDNGVFSNTSLHSKAFADNLQEKIAGTPFKDRVSVEFCDNFKNIKLKNKNQLRLVLTTCPGHQFNVLLDEKNKTITILDNGGLDDVNKNNCFTHFKKLDRKNDFTVNYKQVRLDGRNSSDDCVNHSEVIMEKLCRWLERGNTRKKGGNDSEIPVNISGSNLVDKLMSTSVSVASNLMKMQGGNGFSCKIEGLTDVKSQLIIPEIQKLNIVENSAFKHLR